MACPENELDIERRLEAINQDENPIERERKLNQFYEELAECEELARSREDEPPEPRELPTFRD